jgi:hypothetical protein
MTEQEIQRMGVSPALSAAYDVLDDAGFLNEDRLKLCALAETQGRDPEAFARHLVKLGKALRDLRRSDS